MSQACSVSARRRYGLARVCRYWEVCRSTIYLWRDRDDQPLRVVGKRGPKTEWDDATLLVLIREVLEASPFVGEGYRKVWARLRFKGIRTSRRRVLRLMREASLLAPTRAGREHGPAAHDGSIISDRPDEMYGTDMTGADTEAGHAAIFIATDHHTGECVGIHAALRGSRFEALEPIRQAIRENFGDFRKDVAAGLTVRHDHGSQFISRHYQDELRFLGIMSSPAYIREPEGNGCSERFIRTLKEQVLWIRRFQTVEELRLALHAFKQRYNQQWILERHSYRTPAQVRAAFKAEAAA